MLNSIEKAQWWVAGPGFIRGSRLYFTAVLSALSSCHAQELPSGASDELKVVARWQAATTNLAFVSSDTALDKPAQAALSEAVEIWNVLLVGCRVPKLSVTTSVAEEVKRNGRSQVVLRTKRWCPQGLAECYDPGRAAVTQLHLALDGSGRAVEADIEVNAVDFAWAARPDATRVSLLRAFIHELGHVLGLGEACLSPRDTFNAGQVTCDAEEFRDSVMYPGLFAPRSRVPLGVVLPGKAERDALCGTNEHP